jgi:hypothetical protein
MADERVTVTLPDLARWFLVALLVLGGLGLYLWLAPRTAPVTTEIIAP